MAGTCKECTFFIFASCEPLMHSFIRVYVYVITIDFVMSDNCYDLLLLFSDVYHISTDCRFNNQNARR